MPTATVLSTFCRRCWPGGLLLLSLLACRPGAPAATASAPQDDTFQPGYRFGKIVPTTNRQQLGALYGEENLQDTLVYLVEGMSAPGTILYPEGPDRVEIIWPSEDFGNYISIYLRRPGGRWRDQNTGLSVGMTLAEVAAINQAPLEFMGFDWDYGGIVTSFSGGELNGYTLELQPSFPPGEAASQQFDPLDTELMGEVVLKSTDPKVQQSPIEVAEINLFLDENPPLVMDFVPNRRLDRIRAGSSKQDLVRWYGAQQLQDRPIYLAEGETAPGSALFPDTDNEIEVLYYPGENRKIAELHITQAGSPYTFVEPKTGAMVGLGITLADLAAANGQPFTLQSFNTDFPGRFVDWGSGNLVGLDGYLEYEGEAGEELPPALLAAGPLRSTELAAWADQLIFRYLILNFAP